MSIEAGSDVMCIDDSRYMVSGEPTGLTLYQVYTVESRYNGIIYLHGIHHTTSNGFRVERFIDVSDWLPDWKSMNAGLGFAQI